jgi:hypothetical protein
MESTTDASEEWVRGDVVRDVRSDKEWKICNEGNGETLYHRDQSGSFVIDNYGDEWLLLQFSEPATKVKQGRKWKVVPGTKEEKWIKLLDRNFINLSDAVRKSATNYTGDRSAGASSIVDHSANVSSVADLSTPASSVAYQRTATSSVEDQNTNSSSIVVDSRLNFSQDDSNFDDWAVEDLADDGFVGSPRADDTSLTAVSSSSLQSEVGKKRDAPVQVSTLRHRSGENVL